MASHVHVTEICVVEVTVLDGVARGGDSFNGVARGGDSFDGVISAPSRKGLIGLSSKEATQHRTYLKNTDSNTLLQFRLG